MPVWQARRWSVLQTLCHHLPRARLALLRLTQLHLFAHPAPAPAPTRLRQVTLSAGLPSASRVSSGRLTGSGPQSATQAGWRTDIERECLRPSVFTVTTPVPCGPTPPHLTQGREPKGPGTQCVGQQACCFPDGSCAMMDAICCENEGGEPKGAGSVCLGDSNGDAKDDLCSPPGEEPIPTVSAWGLIVLALLLLAVAKIYFGRRRVPA
jgi:hypothetical protein